MLHGGGIHEIHFTGPTFIIVYPKDRPFGPGDLRVSEKCLTIYGIGYGWVRVGDRDELRREPSNTHTAGSLSFFTIYR